MLVDLDSDLPNPNFPKNLQIHPSNLTTTYDDFDDSSFGSAAQELAIRKYGIAGRVWEAAYAMTLYIHPTPDLELDPPFTDALSSAEHLTIIELGSGSGLVASSLARLLKPGRDHLVVTDLPEVCPLLQANLSSLKRQLDTESPNQDTLIVKPLSWGKLEDASTLASQFFEHRLERPSFGTLTHIICSDLVYFPELLAPLLRSLLHLTSPPFCLPKNDSSDSDSPTVLISYKIRSLVKETVFWSAFGLWFTFSPALVKDKSTDRGWRRFGENFEDPTFLFIARRRPISYNWTIPLLDEHLLGGVGVNGNNLGKGDDTFEELLFMCLEQDR